jgi:hypothetical protein
MFELTDDVKQAWQYAYKNWRASGTEKTLADGCHAALAEVRRLEFEADAWEHYQHEDGFVAVRRRDESDPRHKWILANWQQAVREELESK